MVMVHALRVCQGQLIGKVSYNYHCRSQMHFSSRLDVNFDEVSGARNIGQIQRIMVRA